MARNSVTALFVGGPLDGLIRTVSRDDIHAMNSLHTAHNSPTKEAIYRMCRVPTHGDKLLYMFKLASMPTASIEDANQVCTAFKTSLAHPTTHIWSTSQGCLAGVYDDGKAWVGHPEQKAYKHKTPKPKAPPYKGAESWNHKNFLVNVRADTFFPIEAGNLAYVCVYLNGRACIENLSWKRVDGGVKWVDADLHLTPGDNIRVAWCGEELTTEMKAEQAAKKKKAEQAAKKKKAEQAAKKKKAEQATKKKKAEQATKKKAEQAVKRQTSHKYTTRFPAQGKRRFGGGL